MCLSVPAFALGSIAGGVICLLSLAAGMLVWFVVDIHGMRYGLIIAAAGFAFSIVLGLIAHAQARADERHRALIDAILATKTPHPK